MNAFRIRQFLGSAAAILLLAAVVAEPVQAQRGTVAGQVTDKSNQPVSGASVIIIGTSLQGRTTREGRFTLTNVPAGQYQVQVRLIGYATATSPVTVAAGQTATADFVLTAAAVPLDVVIVSATGQEQLKRESGSNVGTIDAATVAQAALPTNAADLLNSRVPGVEVMQSGGTTGTGSRIRIRGATSLSLRNEPIIVVDGVRVDNVPNADGGLGAAGGQAPSRLNDLNPEDWESVEVVKGPSAAALYGTDAANGVIQIRTKQGRPGPTKWSGYLEGAVLNDPTQWPANYFSRGSNGRSCRLTSQALGSCTVVAVDSFNPLEQNSPFRQGVRQQYGVNVSGGNEATTFYVSGDFQREKGIFESNDLKKTNLRVNLHNQISQLMDLSVTSAYVSSDLALPQNDNNSFGILPSGLLGFAFDTAAPLANVPNPRGGYRFLTPAQATAISATQRIERFTGGLNLNFRPWSFLSVRGTAGYDVNNQGDNFLNPPSVNPFDLEGSAFGYRAQVRTYSANLSSTGSFRLSPVVTSNTTVGVQYTKNIFEQIRASGRRIVTGTGGVGGVVIPAASDSIAPQVTLGGYVEEQIGIRDRVYLTGALRADKNSAFGTEFSNILYPKLSGSWVISEEPFFPRLSWLSSLRLRAAWGGSGRAPGTLDAQRFFVPVAVAADGSDLPGVTIGGVGNAGLKPERTREIETGFDADFAQQRIHFEATYYDKDSKDALVAVPIAGSAGESFTRLDNLGEVSNKGVEFLLSAQVINTPSLSWSVTASAWGNKNRVLATDADSTPIIFGLGGSTQRHQVGYPAGGYWGTSYTARDLNGDGLIDPIAEITLGDSDTFQGSSVPTRGLSISTEVNFLRHFSLHGLLDGRWGGKLDNSTEQFRCLFSICRGLRVPSSSLEEKAAAASALFYGLETGYFEDAGFLKLRELSLTYFAPAMWASRIGASALSLTISGRNLATWTNYKGPDPEVSQSGQFNFSVADFLTQPPVRSFVARVNVTY